MSRFLPGSRFSRPNTGESADPYPTSPQGPAPALANQAQRRSADIRPPHAQGDRKEMMHNSIEGLFAELEEYKRKYRDSQDEVRHIRTEKDSKIETLQQSLNETKQKLKIVQESQLRSQERSQAVDDSFVVGLFNQISQAIKNIIQVLLRNTNADAVRAALFFNPEFQKAIGEMSGEKVTMGELGILLASSPNPLNILRLLIRASIFAMIQAAFFNENMFFGLDPGLQKVYQDLLELEIENESEALSAKRDASLWRSQTLTVIDKNSERIKVSDQREKVREELFLRILKLLDPLGSLNQDSGSKEEDVAALLDNAASLAIILGKQRAMFDLQIARHVGEQFQPDIMYSVGFDSTQGDDDEGASLSAPLVVVTVITPVLVKFGNADGEGYNYGVVQRGADVLAIDAQQWNEIRHAAANKGNESTSSKDSNTVIEKAAAVKTTTAGLDALQGGIKPADYRRRSAEYSAAHRDEKDPGDIKLNRAQTYAVSPIDSAEGQGFSSVDSTASKVSSLAPSEEPGPIAEDDLPIPNEEQKVLGASKSLVQQKNDKQGSSAATSNNGKKISES